MAKLYSLKIAEELPAPINDLPIAEARSAGQSKGTCSVGGYVHTDEQPPEKCPVCRQTGTLRLLSGGNNKKRNYKRRGEKRNG